MIAPAVPDSTSTFGAVLPSRWHNSESHPCHGVKCCTTCMIMQAKLCYAPSQQACDHTPSRHGMVGVRQFTAKLASSYTSGPRKEYPYSSLVSPDCGCWGS
ncbi:hypothetical protein BAUCODRAFT_245122 [Baudoinia panamericana UAMH 10762]|uniref:Uncharacterized protein n=1 Tax=Baudoinia panamericana (strain UAMH 10762) TaxID=717646 RepID=M2N4D1_BAUPA|nr:uncharacterized protein BAUCODRAFT_245122 [Baudoinia panamericana UAMH 10762]EMC93550.1 hypothetical protein BAUCODRAFT_245122 [Baudoinia panamericana UAMH 10762]